MNTKQEASIGSAVIFGAKNVAKETAIKLNSGEGVGGYPGSGSPFPIFFPYVFPYGGE